MTLRSSWLSSSAVEHFRCTPWKDGDGNGVAAINIVVRFSSDRTGVVPAGPARAAALVERAKAGFLKLSSTQTSGMPHWGPWRPEFGVNELFGAWCTACADGYKQFRIASMREGVRVTGTNRCPFMEGLDHIKLVTKASINVPGKDSKEVLQQFNRHEFVEDQRDSGGYLDLAAGGDAATVKLAPVHYATTGHGAAWFTHAATGDPLLSYSDVEGFGAGALIRNACGAGYDATRPHPVTCDCKRGADFAALAYADAASGAIVRMDATDLGRDYNRRPKCRITPAQNSTPPLRVCHVTPTVLAGEIPGMTLAGATRQVTDTLGGRSFRLVALAAGASSPGPGTYAFQLVLFFLPPIRYEDMLCWRADVPARVALPARASIVPSNTGSYCYRALPDSAAGEVYLQRPAGINPVGCNLKCTAGVECHRTFEQQEQCRPFTEREWLHGGVLAGLAARMDKCKNSLAVEAQLLPFLLPLEECIFTLEGMLLKSQGGAALLAMRDSALDVVHTLADTAHLSRQGQRGTLMLQRCCAPARPPRRLTARRPLWAQLPGRHCRPQPHPHHLHPRSGSGSRARHRLRQLRRRQLRRRQLRRRQRRRRRQLSRRRRQLRPRRRQLRPRRRQLRPRRRPHPGLPLAAQPHAPSCGAERPSWSQSCRDPAAPPPLAAARSSWC